MHYGFVLPSGDAQTAADIAQRAEAAGWHGFFVWEPVWGVDAWVSLTAAAMRTERIRLGTMLSPISRMRPWELASKTATLDNLSGGRVILSVGLGALETGFAEFGEVTDRKTRAELMDEGLDIMTGLWRGQPFAYQGKHYTIRPTTFPASGTPTQQPRIPIWVVGAWPRPKSMQRVIKYDGILPMVFDKNGQPTQASANDLRAIRAYVEERRTEPTAFDIVVEGVTAGDDPQRAAETVQPWAEAGATWWIEAMWELPGRRVTMDDVRRRVDQGPPSVRREA